MNHVSILKEHTALVVIDLQKGIVAMPTKPYSSKDVVSNASKLINACRENRLPVFLVHVNPTKETALRPDADITMGGRTLPADWAEFVPEIGSSPSDIIITKHQWGAFHGTELEMQLRRRNITTIILCGIATSIGVESTARFAFEYGYQQVFAEDAMASMTEEEHHSSVNNIFKKMGRVKTTAEILEALKN